MKTVCVFVSQNILCNYLECFLYYTFPLHWDLPVKPPFCWWLGNLWGQAPDRSLQLHYSLDVETACSSIARSRSHQVSLHWSHKQLCCCCSWAKLRLQTTEIPVWVRKQWGSLNVLPAHIHQPSFSNRDIHSIRLHQGNSSTLPSWADKERVRMLSTSENMPHKHLISLEVLS